MYFAIYTNKDCSVSVKKIYASLNSVDTESTALGGNWFLAYVIIRLRL